MYDCTKRNTIASIVSELILINVLQEIKNQIGELQTYNNLFRRLDEKYISRDEVLQLIDEKIKECSE